jgi:hypothetical protein
VVSLWWNAWSLWCVDGHFCGAQNLPHLPDLF